MRALPRQVKMSVVTKGQQARGREQLEAFGRRAEPAAAHDEAAAVALVRLDETWAEADASSRVRAPRASRR